MMEMREIIYFERPGRENTDAVVRAVKRRVKDLGIKYVIVASDSGETALKFLEALKEMNVTLISVAEHASYVGGDKTSIKPEIRKELEEDYEMLIHYG